GARRCRERMMARHAILLQRTFNAERPNPNIDFNATPFYLNHERREWERPSAHPRRAGVSAYGFGGTNFHVVREEYVPGMLKTEPALYTGAATDDRRQPIDN